MANTAIETKSNKVLVQDIPDGLHRNKLYIHFQRQCNGGGDILSLVYPRSLSKKNEAVIAFHDTSTVSTLMKNQHSIVIAERTYEMHVSKLPPQVFDTVSVCYQNDSNEEDSAIRNLLQEFNIKSKPVKGSRQVEYTGEWFEIKAFVERCQDLLHKSSPEVESGKAAHKSVRSVDKPYQLKPGNENSNNVNSEPTDNVIEVDEDLFLVTKKLKPDDLDNIMNQFKVQTSTKKLGMIQLRFDAKNQNYAEGICQFQKIYQYGLEVTKQINYDLPGHIKDQLVEEALRKVNHNHPDVVTTRSVRTPGQILFLSFSEEFCKKAENELKILIGDTRRQLTLHRPQNAALKPLFMTSLQSGLKLAVIRGNIANQETDAIVNAANERLQNGAGVTGAIFRAGGIEFEDECQQLMMKRRYKPLDVGEVVYTRACGDLLCEHVIHVTGPMWQKIFSFDRESKCRKMMKKLCHNLVVCANHNLQATSVSIPAISTGIYGVPLRIFCDAIIDEAKEFDKFSQNTPGRSHLKQINIVNYDYGEAAEIARHFSMRGSSVDP